MKKDTDKNRVTIEQVIPAPKNDIKNKQCPQRMQPQGRLCFIVTQKESSSWVSDLYACERKAIDTTVFH